MWIIHLLLSCLLPIEIYSSGIKQLDREDFVDYFKLGAQGWCTGMTLRDGMGREVGGGVQDGEHMYTHGWFMSMYGKTHYNIVK